MGNKETGTAVLNWGKQLPLEKGKRGHLDGVQGKAISLVPIHARKTIHRTDRERGKRVGSNSPSRPLAFYVAENFYMKEYYMSLQI